MAEERKYTKTPRDIAKMLGCSPRTIVRGANDGEIPALKVRGRYRFNPEQVVLALSNAPKKPSGQ